MPQDRPNFLLVIADQWRADALGCAGHPVAETPTLDTLAATGVRFRHAYAACPSCIPARASLWTGLTPARHGYVGYRDGLEWRYPTTLPGTLSAAGYHTQCVGKMHVHPARNLIGFHNVVLHDGYLHHERHAGRDYGRFDDYTPWLRERLGRPQADYVDTGLGCNGYVVRPWVYDESLHPMTWVTDQSLEFLRRRDPTRPFFLTTSYHRPHPPLDPPQSYLDRFMHKPLPSIPVGDWVQHSLARCHGLDSPIPRDAWSIDLARRAYYAQLCYLDQQINRLVMGLGEEGVLHNTYIVFVADHGDLLYDHDYCAKALPFEASAGVPLIVRPPGPQWTGGSDGSVVDAVVELRDLFPSFCAWAGIPTPGGLDGQSLEPLLRGATDRWRPWLHGEHALGDRSNQWLSDGHTKYCWFTQSGRELLFDLDADPTECHDLARSQPARVELWRQRLIAELADRPEGFVESGWLVAGRPVTATLTHAGMGA